MTYETLRKKLYSNLQELMKQCDEWLVSVYEVAKYRDYMTKILDQYQQTHGHKDCKTMGCDKEIQPS